MCSALQWLEDDRARAKRGQLDALKSTVQDDKGTGFDRLSVPADTPQSLRGSLSRQSTACGEILRPKNWNSRNVLRRHDRRSFLRALWSGHGSLNVACVS